MNIELLESTGYSWSGITDIIYNTPSKTKQLLHEVDEQYRESKALQEKLEMQLERVKADRSRAVVCFAHIHRALDLKEKPLAFNRGLNTVVVKVLDYDSYRIDYESVPLAVEGDSLD